MEKIINAIQNESWEEAMELFLDFTNEKELDDKLCILGATILEHFDDRDSLFEMIQSGLRLNYANYELYLLLGNFYSALNPNKALLSYENALYFSKKEGNSADAEVIENLIADFKQSAETSVRPVSIIVFYDENGPYLQECTDSIINECFTDCYEIHKVSISDYKNRLALIDEAVSNTAKENDIFLLSGDVVLMPNSLFNLRMALYDSDDIGSASAVSNYALYMQIPPKHGVDSVPTALKYSEKYNIPEKHPLESKAIVDGNAVIIRREVFDRVFPLDSNVASDGFVSTDISLSIIKQGYQNVICWNGFVYHYKRDDRQLENLRYVPEDRGVLHKKWGFSSEYYMTTRNELADMIERDKEDSLSVLEVGAGLGSTLAYIKHKYPNANVCGIEIVEEVAKYAAKNVNMKCDNIETYAFGADEKYDYIIFGDVLEHLVDPFALVEKLKEYLNPGGCIIASIPNILNAGAIYEILHGGFEYKNAGILDRTHLRFFTQKEVVSLFVSRGYEIVKMFGIRGAENSNTFGDFFDKLCAIDGVVERYQFDILQYAVCARVIS